MMEEIVRRPIIFIEGGQAFKLACLGGVTSVEHLPEICSSHENTDVRIISYVKHIQTTMSHIKTTRVRAKDSDLFFILLYFAKSFTVYILLDIDRREVDKHQPASLLITIPKNTSQLCWPCMPSLVLIALQLSKAKEK